VALFIYFRTMIKNWYEKIPSFLKSFYFIAGSFFLVWLLIFDSNDIITQMRLSKKQKELEETREFYQTNIEEVKADREALLNSDDLLEKVAREKYLMKQDDEDIFVVVDEE
jgi:cell division protein DivIC